LHWSFLTRKGYLPGSFHVRIHAQDFDHESQAFTATIEQVPLNREIAPPAAARIDGPGRAWLPAQR
jgi:hypothetical protein